MHKTHKIVARGIPLVPSQDHPTLELDTTWVGVSTTIIVYAYVANVASGFSVKRCCIDIQLTILSSPQPIHDAQGAEAAQG